MSFVYAHRYRPTFPCEDCGEIRDDRKMPHICKRLRNDTLRVVIDDLKDQVFMLSARVAPLSSQVTELLDITKAILYHPGMPLAQDLGKLYPNLGKLPKNQGSVPEFGGPVPQNQESVPQNQESVPEFGESVPKKTEKKCDFCNGTTFNGKTCVECHDL